MKKISLLFVFILTSFSFMRAQENNKITFIKDNFPLTHSVIKNEAALKWKGDYEMQGYEIKKQCEALFGYLDYVVNKRPVPESVWDEISSEAFAKWSKIPDPNSSKCASITDAFKKLDCVYAGLVADWEMVVYTIKKQVDAYQKINQ